MARTFVLFLVTIIALSAGGAAIWSAVSLTHPVTAESTDTTARRANAQVVERFYAAANDRLVTGSTAPLSGVITTDFTFHGPTFPDAVGLAALDRHLGSFRSSCPNCVLTVDKAVLEADLVTVSVTAQTDGPSRVFGIPIEGALVAWTGHDLLRIENGSVAEYWSQVTTLPAVLPLADDIFLNLPTGLADVGVIHLSMQPGTALDQGDAQVTRYFIVDSGSLSVGTTRQRRSDGDSSTPMRSHRTLGTGEHITAATGDGFELRNEGLSPASIWMVSIRPHREGAGIDAGWATVETGNGGWSYGVNQRMLGTTIVSASPGGQVILSLGRLTLAPGASIGPHEIAGNELVSVGAGSLQMTVEGGEAQIVPGPGDGPGTRPSDGGRGTVERGNLELGPLDTIVVRGGTIGAIRNTGPGAVELVVAALVPAVADEPAW